MIVKLKAKSKKISLFLLEDTLFVHSLYSYKLYAFKGLDAVLFLLLDEIEDFKEFKKELQRRSIPFKKYQTTISFITTILKGEDKDSFSSGDEQIKHPHFIKAFLKEGYLFKNYFFLLKAEDKNLAKELKEAFNYLKVSIEDTKEYFEIRIKKDCSIFVNNIFEKKLSSKEEVVPFLYGLLRRLYLRDNNFLITLHAASIKYQNRIIVFPGESGRGKSTLCAYFVASEDVSFFSDELTLVQENEQLTAIPLGIGIKEGSWPIFEKIIPNFQSLATYIRFDKQKVKYYYNQNFAKDTSVKGATFIFPLYLASSKNSIKKIDIVTALKNIMRTQYYFSDLTDSSKVERWLNILSSCSFYTLEYSSLKEAKKLIKKVLKNEEV